MTDKTSPSATDPRAGHNPGYAEAQARTAREAHQPVADQTLNPEAGGLKREPGATADPASDD